MRIYELAKELDIPSTEIATRAEEIGVCEKATPIIVLNDEQVGKLKDSFGVKEKEETAETTMGSLPVAPVDDTVQTIPSVDTKDEDGFTPDQQAKIQDMISAAVTSPTVATVKKEPTTPWSPARILDIPERFKDPAFTYRWVNKDRAGNMRKKESEGWEIDTELTRKMSNLATTIEDGTPIDGTIQVREMIVMRLPQERAKARKEYYRDKNVRSIKDKAAHFKKEVGGGYGEIKEG
jgi:hypothetical protein